ncbi:MAG: glucan biosynthesis protein G [Rubrivivax sp.]
MSPSSRFFRAACGTLALLACGLAQAFGFDDVAAQAATLARQPSRPAVMAPASLRALTYDQARDIRFRPERALWRREGLPFEAQFFHLGYVQAQPVRVHEIGADGQARPLPYDSADFHFGKTRVALEALRDLGVAGFRIHAALNDPAYKDELLVFQGASYFRALGAGQRYGLSARGLAIDTVGGRGGEEFPRFSEFWLQRPAPGAERVTVYALLESARATGAYRFEVRPGSDTVVEVQARLFLRAGPDPIRTLGIAPLTSMFFFGENQPHAGDFRPEVHDSDGLQIAGADGEWLWRPLVNPARPQLSSFALRSPRGFGLMQRDRRFAAYEDTEARYELRPSAWVEPLGDWGEGRVELLQLPTPDETHDNVVAYWVPAALPPPGQPLELRYRLHWQGKEQTRPPGGWAAQTRSGRSYAALAADERQFIVDFEGPALAALPADAAVRAVASADGNAELREAHAYRNEATGQWRMALRVRIRDLAQPAELRAFLQTSTDTVSETWTYLIPPR